MTIFAYRTTSCLHQPSIDKYRRSYYRIQGYETVKDTDEMDRLHNGIKINPLQFLQFFDVLPLSKTFVS